MTETPAQTPLVCLLCRTPTELDDVLEGSETPKGGCICLSCYRRATEGTTRVPAAVRADIDAEQGDLLLRKLGPDERMKDGDR